MTAYSTFAGGGGFGGDGYMLVSDQTFLSLFPARRFAAPDHILLTLRPGGPPEAVIARLKTLISDPSRASGPTRRRPRMIWSISRQDARRASSSALAS